MTSEEKADLPEIKSKHSLTAECLTKDVYAKLKGKKTKVTGSTIEDCCVCAMKFDDQHVGCYANDENCYVDFKAFFEPVISKYHSYGPDQKHKANLDASQLKGNVDKEVPVKSTRIRVARNLAGFGLSPGISKEKRLELEKLMIEVFSKLEGDLAGKYYPLLGMKEEDRKQLVDDHFLFMSGDKNLIAAGMERDWPEGRGIFHNNDKTFLLWLNEEDQLRIISMQKGGDVAAVFERLVRGINAIEKLVKEKGHSFLCDERYGFISTCPSNLGTGMRASVHLDLPTLGKDKDALKKRCTELKLQPRGTRGESSGDTGTVFDLSNKHRLGYSEVELVQTMIDGVNTLYKEDQGKK